MNNIAQKTQKNTGMDLITDSDAIMKDTQAKYRHALLLSNTY